MIIVNMLETMNDWRTKYTKAFTDNNESICWEQLTFGKHNIMQIYLRTTMDNMLRTMDDISRNTQALQVRLCQTENEEILAVRTKVLKKKWKNKITYRLGK